MVRIWWRKSCQYRKVEPAFVWTNVIVTGSSGNVVFSFRWAAPDPEKWKMIKQKARMTG